ncbi:hypothetical protein HMJ29_18310 [Hymenobacter taeanensis]|uniref:STAS/SEC14 domain-containing protein n=1 Tax=Hymenobacter taeanensis TaxID=2735321 RepID=A0A6M6BMT0_9BACT|nr:MULTISPECIES: hypothetical protein [Hymenobacter]QJX48763.1 hypothetical protein HMJ29_18310 [Hymenobacter taeanensis]UOQ81732.1 hypothetical protein MUN83_02765 [Hymenobacter sp. 5414T-23]
MLLLTSLSSVSFYLHNIGCRALEARWSDHGGSAVFRESIMEGLALARQYQAECWIADDRQLGPMLPADLEWVATDVLPALAESGIRRLAIVESEDLLNRELIQEAYIPPLEALPIEVRHFTDLPTARAWACGK